jgi:uncharacterized membrane protein YphA (DoxX/SURF4 family)
VNIVLWILQGLLAAAFLMAGALKVSQPIAKLEKNMSWVTRFPVPVVRFVGAVEILGALGLILPWATGIARVLTPLAAVGLAITMVLAALHHMQHKEYKGLPVNGVLFVIAVVIAIGRFSG